MIDDERARRVGHNEALYRQVNEQIEHVSDGFGGFTDTLSIVCECGELGCAEPITVSREAYERTRGDASAFIVKPGHEIPDVEDVVERETDYVVVEKHAAAAKRVAEETDPRR